MTVYIIISIVLYYIVSWVAWVVGIYSTNVYIDEDTMDALCFFSLLGAGIVTIIYVTHAYIKLYNDDGLTIRTENSDSLLHSCKEEGIFIDNVGKLTCNFKSNGCRAYVVKKASDMSEKEFIKAIDKLRDWDKEEQKKTARLNALKELDRLD